MGCDWLVLFAPVGALAVNVVVQLAAHFLRPSAPIVASYAAGFMVGAAVSILPLVRVATAADAVAAAIVSFLTFGALSYCYSNFVNLGFSSLRIRVLKEICREGGCSDMGALRARYGSEAILERRIARLVEWGQLRVSGGRYHAVPGFFLHLARAFTVLKKLLLGRGFRYEGCRSS